MLFHSLNFSHLLHCKQTKRLKAALGGTWVTIVLAAFLLVERGNRKENGNILKRGSGHRRKALGIIGGTRQASEIIGGGQKSSEGMTS